MNWLPMLLGGMLGYGIMLVFQGMRVVINKELVEEARRKGFWKLNGGLVLIAMSVIAFANTAWK